MRYTNVYYFNIIFILQFLLTSGMGKVICDRLLELEAKVIGIGLNMDDVCNTNNFTKMTVDISKWDEAYNEVFKIGPVHGLVNNAGVAFIQPFLQTTQHAWD